MKTVKEFLNQNWLKIYLAFIFGCLYLLWMLSRQFSDVAYPSDIILALLVMPIGFLLGIGQSLGLNEVISGIIDLIIIVVYFYLLLWFLSLIFKKIKNLFLAQKSESSDVAKKDYKLTKQVVIILLSIISVFLFILVFADIKKPKPNPWINQRAIAVMTQIQSIARVIYEKESSYESVNCNFEDIKPLCDDVEKRIGNKPIIYGSKTGYCAYTKLTGGGFYCVDSLGISRKIDIYPGGENYCDGETFKCPQE